MITTYLLALLGGVLIGLASSGLLLFNGRIAGISGILNGAASTDDDAGWRRSFVAGLIVGGFIVLFTMPEMFPAPSAPLDMGGLALFASSGALVGFGTRLGNGCTSGHGVCGLGRLSKRSVAAVVTFIAFGALTVFTSRHVLGG